MCGKILVVQTAFPGDIVLTTPLLSGIKRIFPGGRLSLLTTPQGCELLKGSGEVDTLIPYDKRGVDGGLLGYVKMIRLLRREGFDLCIAPHRSARTTLMVFSAAIPERIGFSDASLAALYTGRVSRDGRLHEVERLLSLLAPLGADTEKFDKSPHLEVTPEAREKVEEMFRSASISPKDRVVGIAPGSVWATKMWTSDGYASVIDELVERYGVKVLLMGSQADRRKGKEIIGLCRHRPVDLTGRTTLGELVAVVDRCRMLIGNDSAPGHIAAARKIPVVSIFGPTVPAFGYYPYGEKVSVVEKPLPCRPCHHHGPRRCPERHFRCMRDIVPDDVMKEVERFMRR